MWLEASLACLSISGVCGSVLLVSKLFPAEVERFLRMVRAEIESRLPKKRPSIEIALHADLDVDMAWWDEEFAKVQGVQRGTLADSWGQYVEYAHSAIQDRMPPTTEEFERWHRSGIKSVTDGNVTYATEHLNGAKRMAVEDGIRAALTLETTDCEFCEYVEHHTYASATVRRFKTGLCWECAERDKKGRASVATLSQAGYALGAGYITFADAEAIIEEISHRA